jgi:ADP-ribose pyrophosphatase YjhB (NUDIX family)
MKSAQSVMEHKAMCKLHGIRSYTTKVIILWGDKIIVLKRDKKTIELVGGMNKPEDKENILATAVRKVFEETGIRISSEQLYFVTVRNDSRDRHTFYCFKVVIDDESTRGILQEPCDNGGTPKAYCIKQILDLPMKLPKIHQEIVSSYLLAA